MDEDFELPLLPEPCDLDLLDLSPLPLCDFLLDLPLLSLPLCDLPLLPLLPCDDLSLLPLLPLDDLPLLPLPLLPVDLGEGLADLEPAALELPPEHSWLF